MAYILQLSDVIQFKFFCNNLIQNGINVLGYQVGITTVAGVTDQDAATAISGVAAPLYKAYLSTQNRYAGVKAQVIRPVLQPAVISTNANGNGTQATDPLPPQVAFLLSPRTAVAGRKGRGRVYLPFWNEGQSDSPGSPNAGAIALATAWSNGLFATLSVTVGGSTITLKPVIVSRTLPITQIPVTSVVIRTAWATQRRRSLITKPDVLGP